MKYKFRILSFIRTLQAQGTLALDLIWNPVGWNTTNSLNGTYRAFVAVTDENDVILKHINGSDLTTFYDFTIQ